MKVNVLFNKDMNKDVQPQVSFGPAFPITDYTVHPGYQLFRVAGAQASDDP
ncbi:hypothetical protein [Clostridium sp.]|uniref:hypothetical protein n=1 Tax=Clostridium sp. TaxID=1506 RepID=UPI001A648546|nr:hypothetical protein [Clostridium sp.]MBK5240765.1 hypothetical protein [Clostridium sp.]